MVDTYSLTVRQCDNCRIILTPNETLRCWHCQRAYLQGRRDAVEEHHARTSGAA